MDWCVKVPKEANHPPVAVINKNTDGAAVRLQAKAGDKVPLSASGSTDPDGNALSYRWWVYREVGTYDGRKNSARPRRFPVYAAGTAIHVILEVSDDGRPRLSRYRQVVVEVRYFGDTNGCNPAPWKAAHTRS